MSVPRFLVFLAVGVLLAPLAAEAQQAGKVWRIGFLGGQSPTISQAYLAAFRTGLRDLGYVEGTHVVIEPRYGEFRPERFHELAAELWRSRIDVFVVHGATAVVRAAEQASNTVPIVFVANPDPIGAGFAASLARPGGRITGISDAHSDLVAKRVELLKEAAPSVSRVAVLHQVHQGPTYLAQLQETQAAATALRLTVVPVEIRTAPETADIDRALSTIRKERGDALIVLGSSAGTQVSRVADLAVKSRILTMGNTRGAAERGYLMAYGANFYDLYRRAATYVDKIVKGANPGELPIEQPTKFDLYINLKTARAIGITIPPSLLLRADHVIQ